MLHIDKAGLVFHDDQIEKFNLKMVSLCEMFKPNKSKSKRQNIDEEIQVEFSYIELLKAWVGDSQ